MVPKTTDKPKAEATNFSYIALNETGHLPEVVTVVIEVSLADSLYPVIEWMIALRLAKINEAQDRRCGACSGGLQYIS